MIGYDDYNKSQSQQVYLIPEGSELLVKAKAIQTGEVGYGDSYNPYSLNGYSDISGTKGGKVYDAKVSIVVEIYKDGKLVASGSGANTKEAKAVVVGK